MRVTLISLVLCLHHLFIENLIADLRFSSTIPDNLNPPVSTTETHPESSRGIYSTQEETIASMAQVGDATEKLHLLKTETSPYAITANQKIIGHATVSGSRTETESHSTLPYNRHTYYWPTTNRLNSLPREEKTASHESGSTETARELNRTRFTKTWIADMSNNPRFANTIFDGSQKDQHTATHNGQESSSLTTASGDYNGAQNYLFTSTYSSRLTGPKRSKQRRDSSATSTTISPNYAVTLPGAYEPMSETNIDTNSKTQRDDTSHSVVNQGTTIASTNQTDNSRTLQTGWANGLNNSTEWTVRGNNNLSRMDCPECGEVDESPPLLFHGSTRLVCFLILWALAVTASVFLGLTVFMWVRYSVQEEKERSRGRGERLSGLNLENLWVDQTTSVDERVEFWYANGTTLGHNQGGRERERERRDDKVKKGLGKEKLNGRDCENLWIQPKVTLEEITDFWYANGRTIAEDATDQKLLETCV
ncbi:hypothetical protein UPYG_G00111390 [Umbra pygmaea]|uniref:Uncharacterized protein n=1 Tax=Umbra pygmaea TaxID=75934 RepID=A0ABD0XIJ7_UMBPY